MNALDPELISFIKNRTVNYGRKRNQLRNTLNIPQLTTIYKSLYGKLPDSIFRNKKDEIIGFILRKVNSSPTKTWGIKGKRSQRMRKTMNKIQENNINIFELPNPVPGQPRISFELIRVPGDGDCFYHAIKRGGLGSRELTKNTRKAMANMTNDTEVKNRLLRGDWAENEEIQLAADKYKTCFAIWDSSVQTWQIFYNNPKPPSTNVGTQGCKKVVYLYNHGIRPESEREVVSSGYHYDLLKII